MRSRKSSVISIVRMISILLAVMLMSITVLTGCAQSAGTLTEGTQTEEGAKVGTEEDAEADKITQTAQTEITQTQQAETGEKLAEAETKPLSNADEANYEFTRAGFPKMDGSTSMVPLGKAVASVLLGESPDEVADLVAFNKTTQSFRNLKDGSCDILIVGEPNAAVFDEMKAENFKYELEEIATDALIFVVNEDNPVDNLTTDQLRDIYSGKITNWKEVGGEDAPIKAFQRNEGAGSQALMKKLVMKDTPLADAPTTLIASEMGELMESVKSYDNSANAIGYSVYYYANDMKKADGLKIISVDGVEPSAETIRTSSYPHLNAYYCVIDANENEDSPARILYNWMMSKDGQALVAAEGYVAAKDPDELDTVLPGGQIVKTDYTYYRKLAIPENKFTRLSEGEMNALEARDDYGFIYPYSGSLNYSEDETGYAYETGALKGFFDEQSRLITDPVYNSIDALTYYDDKSGTMKTVPIWILSRALKDKLPEYEDGEYEPEMEYSFATMDGSYVCDNWYSFIEVYDDRIICTYMDNKGFDSYDLTGKKMLTSDKCDAWKLQPGKYVNGDEWIKDVRYGNGLYVVTISMEETYYVDENGKTVDGPYTNAQPYADELAIAEGPGDETADRFGVIDKKGSWVIDPKFDYIDRLRNGNFICSDGEDKYVIFDTDGNRLNEVTARYIERTNFGFTSQFVTQEEEEAERLRCYDFTGGQIFEDTIGGWHTAGNDGIIYRQMGAGVQLRNIFTEKSIYVEGADQANPFYRLEDTPDVGKVVVRNSYYDEETGYFYCHERVYDTDLELLFDQTDTMLMIEEDQYTGDWYFMYELKGSQICIRDADFNDVCTLAGYPEIVNGKFIVEDEYACTCYDKDGEIVFSYSLLKSMGD